MVRNHIEGVKKFYSGAVEYEWGRLMKNAHHKLEFDTTLHFLEKYLPKKGLILDAGGGPGRYTIELAKRGYDVVLLDLAPASLEFAKKQIKKEGVSNKVKQIVEGSITDLSMFKNNTFDAVICLGGPLSHVFGEKQRDKALSELIRVAKKDVPIFVSVINRIGTLLRAAVEFPEEVSMTKHFRGIWQQGEDLMFHGKHYCHYFLPEEFRGLFLKKQVKVLEFVGLEGLTSPTRERFSELPETDKKAWKNWIECHYSMCTHPAVVGASCHIIIVCKKL